MMPWTLVCLSWVSWLVKGKITCSVPGRDRIFLFASAVTWSLSSAEVFHSPCPLMWCDIQTLGHLYICITLCIYLSEWNVSIALLCCPACLKVVWWAGFSIQALSTQSSVKKWQYSSPCSLIICSSPHSKCCNADTYSIYFMNIQIMNFQKMSIPCCARGQSFPLSCSVPGRVRTSCHKILLQLSTL
jgi:hypothetical protein